MSGNNKKKSTPSALERDLMVFPPAIPIHPKPKKKADDEKEDETKIVTFKVTIGLEEDPMNSDKTDLSFRVLFEDGGDAEDYVKWRIRFEELAEAMHLETLDMKYHVLQQALRGEARARFNTAWHNMEVPSSLSPNKAMELSEKRLKKGYNALVKQLFVPVESAWRRQRSYLRYHVKFGNMTVAEFKHRLVEQNEFLKYFPTPPGKNPNLTLSRCQNSRKKSLSKLWTALSPLSTIVTYWPTIMIDTRKLYKSTERLEVKYNIQKAMVKRDNQQGNNGDESKGRKNRKKRRKNGGKGHGNTNNGN